MNPPAHFRVDTRLATLLADTYRSSERALKELIDNSWDADAETVRISLPDVVTVDPIVIEDDGSGMTPKEVQDEYLVIANDRRSRKGERSLRKNRKIKGRKGIGKFAGLMAASTMTLETRARGSRTCLHLDKDFLQQREIDLEGVDLPLDTTPCSPEEHGTKVTLTELNQKLTFPSPEKLKELLVLEYGRDPDFQIFVNGQALAIEDLPGRSFETSTICEGAGPVRMRGSVADGGERLRQSGIVFRVDGKIVGRPTFLGLEQDETIPRKLLRQVYGEIEADGLLDDVTADWGAIIENSKGYEQATLWARNQLKEQLGAVFAQEMNLARARLQKTMNQRLASLPEYRRQFAQRMIEKALQKFYGESDERIEVIVGVVLDALEHDEYWMVIHAIDGAPRSDVVAIAEALADFGLADMAVMARQARVRLRVLDDLDRLIKNDETSEARIHRIFEKNLWLLGSQYSLIASNKTLASIVGQYIDKDLQRRGRGKMRPDLFLAQGVSGNYLLIEFKRPSHAVSREDEAQAQQYRDDLSRQFPRIDVLVLGGSRQVGVAPQYDQVKLSATSYGDVLSHARTELTWLLQRLNES